MSYYGQDSLLSDTITFVFPLGIWPGLNIRYRDSLAGKMLNGCTIMMLNISAIVP